MTTTQPERQPNTNVASTVEHPDTLVVATTKKTKKSPSTKTPDTTTTRPKRPLSAFLLFSKAERANVAREHPGASLGEISKWLGERWKAADAETKGMYHAQHAASKADLGAVQPVSHVPTAHTATASANVATITMTHAPENASARPKRPPSAFLLFSKAERANVAREHPGASLGEISKRLGERWKAADAETKGVYHAQHAASKANVETATATTTTYTATTTDASTTTDVATTTDTATTTDASTDAATDTATTTDVATTTTTTTKTTTTKAKGPPRAKKTKQNVVG